MSEANKTIVVRFQGKDYYFRGDITWHGWEGSLRVCRRLFGEEFTRYADNEIAEGRARPTGASEELAQFHGDWAVMYVGEPMDRCSRNNDACNNGTCAHNIEPRTQGDEL